MNTFFSLMKHFRRVLEPVFRSPGSHMFDLEETAARRSKLYIKDEDDTLLRNVEFIRERWIR